MFTINEVTERIFLIHPRIYISSIVYGSCVILALFTISYILSKSFLFASTWLNILKSPVISITSVTLIVVPRDGNITLNVSI